MASVYFVPAGIQRTRLNIMQKGTSKIGLKLALQYRNDVNYVVSELDNYEMVLKAMKVKEIKADVVKGSWIVDCLKAGHLLHNSTYLFKHTEDDLLKPKHTNREHRYLCQNPTLLDHRNEKFVRALEILAQEAEMRTEDVESSRALAFRKAAGALKQLPREIKRIEDISELTAIGQHSRTVVQEILEESSCREANEIESSEWFQTIKLFSSVYGIGPSKANRLYNEGFRTLGDVKSSTSVKIDKRISIGLEYHSDISTPVTKYEAECIMHLVSTEVKKLFPDAVLYLMGGFRRGKQTGHDIDILISHPAVGTEVGLLAKLCNSLHSSGLILHQDIELRKARYKRGGTMDNFDKSFTIFKLPTSNTSSSVKSLNENAWVARRVDLIVCPFNELPFAIVGWTGNKLFNRSLRDYAKKEQNMRLTSHGLYDLTTNSSIAVSSEEELFDKLKLPFLKPCERNL